MEGPSLIILREELRPFIGKKVISVSGNSQVPIGIMKGKKLLDVKTWGKLLFLIFENFEVRIHFLMYGSYRIDERKDRDPRLALKIRGHEFNTYSCSVRIEAKNYHELHDSRVDVMSEDFDVRYVFRLLKLANHLIVCDALLNQKYFSGSGNIIKNEVLLIEKLHPETKLGDLNDRKLLKLIRTTRAYSHQFYEWKKNYELKKNWKIYRKKFCGDCGTRTSFQRSGENMRVTYFCPHCQKKPPKHSKQLYEISLTNRL